MKRIIMLVFMATSALMSQAETEITSIKVIKPGFHLQKSDPSITSSTATMNSSKSVSKPESCTVTMKGSVNGGVFSVEVSCTATSSSCEQATSKATSCLSLAIRKARQNLS